MSSSSLPKDVSAFTSTTDIPNHTGTTTPLPPDTEKHLEPQLEREDAPPPRDIDGWRWTFCAIAILSSIFLYALDSTIVAAIQPLIVAEYDAVDRLAWLSVAFLLAGTVTNMLWGRIYTQFNAKWVYVFNVFLFEVGSAVCGAAPNMDVMILGRALCGISGAGLYVGVMTLIALTTTMAERPLYVSGTGVTWGLGVVLGPLVGGGFSESKVGWRWSFYINLFIGAICAPAWLWLLPSKEPRPGVSFKRRLAEMDYVGTALLMGGLTTFILAINWGGITYPWNSGRIVGLFVTSGVLLILLAIQQTWALFTTVPRRTIPVQFFRSRTVLLLFSGTAASGTASFLPIYFIPLFFQFTRNDSALDAGVRLLPLIILLVFGTLVNGAFMAKFGYYMPWYLLGGVLVVIGSALMYTVDQGTSQAHIYGYIVLMGLGVGMFTQAGFSVAQAVVEPENVPQAVGFITLGQFLGVTMGLALGNTVFLNKSEAGISKILPDVPRSDIRAAIEGSVSGLVSNLRADLRERVFGAIVDAISTTYVLVIVAGAFVVLISLAMKRERLFMNAGVAAG